MKYAYFVSFTYASDTEKSPIDNTIITVDGQINTVADVENLESAISQKTGKIEVTAIYFKLLGKA